MATGDDLELGATNSANHETHLSATASFAAGLLVTNSGIGSATNPATALRGEAGGTDRAVGVWGRSTGRRAIGVSGEGTDGIGVKGKATRGTAVLGEANNGTGVVGTSTGSNPGVRGSSRAGHGVRGHSATGTGVRGTSDRDTGVRGTGNWGVVAEGSTVGVLATASAGVGIGVVGVATGIGVWGGSESGFAGRFDGDVFINGDLTKTGAGSCVAVPFPDGSLRRLYSIESPESWFEDFGEGKVVNGKAQVTIDPKFSAVVRGDYHVFLTPYGDSNGLYVSQRTRKHFVVREQAGGKATLSFSYRLVAKRKDIAGPRLEKVTLPKRPQLPRPRATDR